MPAAAIGAVATIGGSMIASSGARSAASTAASGAVQAAQIEREAGLQAREDILRILDPAMQDYINNINRSRDAIVRGDQDVIGLLTQTAEGADRILAQSGADVQKLILGSRATSSGVPRATFESQYQSGTYPGQPGAPSPGGISGQYMPSYETQAPPTASEGPFRMEGLAGAAIGGRPSELGAEAAPAPVPRYMYDQTRSSGTYFPPGITGSLAGAAIRSATQPDEEPVDPLDTYLETPTPTGKTAQLGGVDLPDIRPGAGVTPPPGTGYYQARGDLEDARGMARGDIMAGRGAALRRLGRGQDILAATEGRGLARTAAFTDAGREAARREAALTGALGPEAQREAINSFIESPGQAYLREQQEKALLRSASATGGLGGANVLKALQEQAMGIAATQQQQQIANLGTIAGRGAGLAAGEQAFIGQMGMGQAGFEELAAGVETGAAKDLATIEAQYGPAMANLAMQTGMNLAQIQGMTDQQRAGLLQSVGSQIAATRGGTLADLAGSYMTEGSVGLDLSKYLAGTLANIGTQSATGVAGHTAAGAQAAAAGQMAANQAIAKGVTGAGIAAGYGLGQLAGQQQPGTVSAAVMPSPSQLPQMMIPNTTLPIQPIR